METKFAVINHATLKVFKFQTKDELLDAIVAIRKKHTNFTAFRYFERSGNWLAFEAYE